MSATAAALMAMGAVASGAASATTPLSQDWQLRIQEGRVSHATLSFEVQDTDNQILAFACEEGGNRIVATRVGSAKNLSMIVMEAGDQKFTVGGKNWETEIPEMPLFTSNAMAADLPILAAFRDSGAMTLTAQGRRHYMPSSHRAKNDIARFLEFCGE